MIRVRTSHRRHAAGGSPSTAMSVAMASPTAAASPPPAPASTSNEQLSALVLAACDSDRFWEAGQDPFWTPPRTASATRTQRGASKRARDKPPSHQQQQQQQQQQSSTGFRHHADTQQYILRYRAKAIPKTRGLSAQCEGNVDAVSPPPVEIDPHDLVPVPAVSTAYIPDRRLSLRSTSIPQLSTHSAATFERLNHIANGGGRSEKARRKKNSVKHMSMMTPETTPGELNSGHDSSMYDSSGAAAELWRQYDDYDASDVPSVPATHIQTGQNDPFLCPISAAPPGPKPPPVSKPVVRAIGNARSLESPGKLQVRSVGLRRKNPTSGDGKMTKNGKPPLAPISMLTRSSWQRRDSVAETAKTTPMQANSLIQTFRIGMRPDRGSTPPLHAVKKRGGGREDPPHKRDNGKRDTLPKIRPSSSFGSDRIEGSPTAERTAAQLTPRGRKRRMLLYGGDVTDATVERLTSRMMSTLQMIQDKALPADSKRNSPSHQRASKSKSPFGVPGQFSHTSRHTDALSSVLSTDRVTDRMTKRSSKARAVQRDPFSFKRR